MKRLLFASFLALALAAPVLADSHMEKAGKTADAAWSMNATIIEACSCPMFCQCYFNTKPSAHAGHEGHGEEHYCRANNVFKVNKGNYGATKLDGAKFWIAMDLGDDFSDGEMDWAIITFDPSVTTPPRLRAIRASAVRLFVDLIWTLCPGLTQAALERSLSKNQ